MPQTLDPEISEFVAPPNPVRWTRQQCYAMQDARILTGRYELIEGEIISKMGQKRRHALTIVLLTDWLFRVFGARFVQIQLPVVMPGPDRDTSEPEPDAVVTRRAATEYPDENPGAEEVLLAIEVADTSLGFDRSTKAALYARAGIMEYWIIDILGRKLLVHRQPGALGYDVITAYGEEESLSPLARPEAQVRVSELLPPA
jgi:Uma2 family endonuclease